MNHRHLTAGTKRERERWFESAKKDCDQNSIIETFPSSSSQFINYDSTSARNFNFLPKHISKWSVRLALVLQQLM